MNLIFINDFALDNKELVEKLKKVDPALMAALADENNWTTGRGHKPKGSRSSRPNYQRIRKTLGTYEGKVRERMEKLRRAALRLVGEK